MGWVVNATPRPHCSWERAPPLIVQEAGMSQICSGLVHKTCYPLVFELQTVTSGYSVYGTSVPYFHVSCDSFYVFDIFVIQPLFLVRFNGVGLHLSVQFYSTIFEVLEAVFVKFQVFCGVTLRRIVSGYRLNRKIVAPSSGLNIPKRI